MTTSRAGKIVFGHPAKPELIAKAIDAIRVALDLADDEITAVYYSHLGVNTTDAQLANAWHQVAVLLADTAEIDSQTLSALSHSIHRGTQDALFG